LVPPPVRSSRADTATASGTQYDRRDAGKLACAGAAVLLLWTILGAAQSGASAALMPPMPATTDIQALSPIPLRREISRAEGRISDLSKERNAALAGFEAAVAAARGAEAALSAGGPEGTHNTAPIPAPDAAEPLLEPVVRAERRRAIEQDYIEPLAAARARLRALLDHQARIDPDAPDQTRLRGIVNADE
jgi:hypothetical protein